MNCGDDADCIASNPAPADTRLYKYTKYIAAIDANRSECVAYSDCTSMKINNFECVAACPFGKYLNGSQCVDKCELLSLNGDECVSSCTDDGASIYEFTWDNGQRQCTKCLEGEGFKNDVPENKTCVKSCESVDQIIDSANKCIAADACSKYIYT